MTAGVDVSLRVAEAADLDTLVRLAVAFRDHLERPGPSEDEFRSAFATLLGDASAEFVLARDATGCDVGYVQSRFRRSAWSGGIDAELEDVFVAAEARGLGVGERLLRFALERALARGCRIAGLATNERNAPALALYGRLGFRAERARWSGGRQLWLEKPLP
ncbi:MAG TPA: GNAT family N-acetyltransferase [Myxococcota bacterium]|nr:GNAT family N-acetyltransferase [Myxococcota bacterium]